MSKSNTFVGLDVHKHSIQVAMLLPGREDYLEWSSGTLPKEIRRLISRLKKEAVGDLHVCYEAGPCGYVLQHQVQTAGVLCDVIAPSLTPKKPGDRIKTDRRDARKLAKYLRGGDLTVVHPPTRDEEAVRDVCRARDDAREDLQSARHRLQKLLLRRGLATGFTRKLWTQAHSRWIETLVLERPTDRVVLDQYLLSVRQIEQRIKTLDDQIAQIAATEPYREVVSVLRAFRGVDTLTAMVFVAELHQFYRFTDPRKLMAYLGLVPTEDSSADRKRRGGITKTGNAHVRRILVEAAQHYRHPVRIGAALRVRRKNQPAWVIEIADKAMQRLHRRHWALANRQKPHCKIVVAIARELAGFLWAAVSRTSFANAC